MSLALNMAATGKAAVVRWLTGAFLLLCVSVGPALCEGGSCKERGFSPSLLCSSCDELKQFGLETLEEGCRECCQSDSPAAEGKARARG